MRIGKLRREDPASNYYRNLLQNKNQHLFYPERLSLLNKEEIEEVHHLRYK
jgi:hypothetical protein